MLEEVFLCKHESKKSENPKACPYVAADLSDLTKESILNVEAGRTDPKLSTLLAIADALHVPLAELFDAPQPAQQPEPVQKQYDALAWAYVKIAERCIARMIWNTQRLLLRCCAV